MSAVVTYSCDGHRHGQPCRGALHTRTDDVDLADREAAAAGWRIMVDGVADVCPSGGHDEDGPPDVLSAAVQL